MGEEVKASIDEQDGHQLFRCRGSDRYELRVSLPTKDGEKTIALRFDPAQLKEWTVVDVNGGPEIEDT